MIFLSSNSYFYMVKIQFLYWVVPTHAVQIYCLLPRRGGVTLWHTATSVDLAWPHFTEHLSACLLPTTTYEETFISIGIYISLLLLLKTPPAILNCHAWISSKSAQMLSLNFRNLLGDKPSVTLYTTDLQEEQSNQNKDHRDTGFSDCYQPWEPNSLLWTPQ